MPTEGRLLGGLLALSLLLNLFLGGLLIGGRVLPGPESAQRGFAPAAAVRRLPPEERALWRRALAPHRAAIRAARDRVRAARAEVQADLAAASLDRGRAEADLRTLRTASLDQQTRVQEGLLDGLAALSPAARLRLVGAAAAPPAPARREGPPQPLH